MALATGNIAFVGFNADGNDNIAFVALVDIGSGEQIIFEDNEWNGTTFVDTNEGAFSWTATSIVPAGTIVRIDNIGSGAIAASTGTAATPVTGRGTNRGIGASGETIYAYQGSAAAPTFITAVTNGGFVVANGVLSNTGLTAGTNAIDLSVVDPDADIAAYNGTRSGQASFSSYLTLINNPANWLTQDGTGDQSIDGTPPDVPFSSTVFQISGGNPTVNLSVSSNSGSEASASIITVIATASSAVTGNQTVSLGVSGTGITAGDYTLSDTTITIPNGTTTGSVTFTIVNDGIAEGAETAILAISSPTSGITLGGTVTQNIAITDSSGGGLAPTISENTASPLVNLAATIAGSVSGAIGDPTDPAKFLGIDFGLADTDSPVGNLIVTATSNNAAVVPNANLSLSGTGAARNLKINPTGVGFADITVSVSDGSNTANYTINYAASAASGTPSTSRFLTGTSDASTAVDVGGGYILVGDDEDQVLRLFDRDDSGLSIAGFDFSTSLGLSPNNEVDIEASTRSGNTIYWLGSHSNSSVGNDRPERERIFSTTVTGTGATTSLTYAGRYDFLEDDLIAWDNANGHGLGAGFLGLSASAAAGVAPEAPAGNGFSIEGLTLAPNGTTAYVSFRAPIEPTTNRTKALIVSVTNFTSILSSGGSASGSATFGAPIQLDLGGRGIREIQGDGTNGYVIVAGPADAATGVAPKDFRLYTWTGNAVDIPVLRAANLTSLNTGGSFESLILPSGALTDSSQIQVISDNGDTVWYANGVASKNLSPDNFQKFRTDTVTIGAAASNTDLISGIQGTGTTSPVVGSTKTIEGIVVGAFPGLGGFYVQEENADQDANPLTSEGISVFSSATVAVGDKVRVTGTVAEFVSTGSSLTQLASTTVSVLSNNNPLPTTIDIDLPVTAASDLERYEGMLVRFPEPLTVTEHFQLGRFGQVVLSANGRLITPTNVVDPNDNPASGNNVTGTTNVAAVTALQTANNLRKIVLDDASSAQNPATVPYLNPANNTLRIGSNVNNLTGVLDDRNGAYRVQPTVAPSFNYAARPLTPPNVGANANVKLASFNVLNYFTNLDNNISITNEIGLFYEPRGAETATEFTRQRDKIISAINQLGVDVVGLTEIENNGSGATSAISNLVSGLNNIAGPGTYAFINDPVGFNSNPGGTDAIKVAFIYKPSKVTPFGNAIAPNDSAFTAGRTPVAQTFTVNSNGAKFTPIINHFKSKGSVANPPLPGDTEQNDGQALSNATRKAQSSALLNFINNIVIPTSGDPDVVVFGDLNAYTQEDPIDVLRAGGLIRPNTATESYVFGGQTGSLDHALISGSLASQLTGVEHWNINSDEPTVIDYNTNFKTAAQISGLYSPDPFRSSDHDPVLVGLNLLAVALPATQIVGTAGRDTLTGTAANETFTGRDGADQLTGGGGNDTFVYEKINDGGDRITDFTVGGDVIALGSLFTSLSVGPFTYATATGQGFLNFLTSGSNTIVQIDRDGSASSAFAPLSFITALGVNSATLANAANFSF